MKTCLAAATIAFLGLAGCAGQGMSPEGTFQAWPQSIEVRAYPASFSRDTSVREIELAGLAGEYLSAQVLVKSSVPVTGLKGVLTDLTGPGGAVIPADSGQVRYGAFLPVDETQLMTADPLLECPSIDLKANEAQPVWLTLRAPFTASPGRYAGTFTVSTPSGQRAEFELEVEVLPAALSEPPDWKYYLNIWQDPSGIATAHKVQEWSPEHWALLEKYARDFASHGMDVITASIVYDPWESQTGYPYAAMVDWTYPGEYKVGEAGKFEWDFAIFDRYVELMLAAGVKEKIDCFSMVHGPWINVNAGVRYRDTNTGEYREVVTKIGEPAWKDVWRAFLPAFEKHLKEKGWFDITYLAFDEKPEKEMRVIYDYLAATAPWFKVSIAGGYPGDEKKQSDEVILHVGEILDEHKWQENKPLVEKMRSEGRYISFYTACEPFRPNVFLYSQLREARLLPWLAPKYNLCGYLRWAVAAFPEDVWTEPNYKWHSGDMYFVYPGPEGPLDGMRWEVFRQGVQDCEVLRIARELARNAGRQDLLDKLDQAVGEATILDSCDEIPPVSAARETVNAVLRELGS